MSNFRTEIKIPKSKYKIGHTDKIFSIGSCFSENIYQKLKTHLFDTYCNPCGIVYNPYSIAHQMHQILNEKKWDTDDLLTHDYLIHGLHHHGEYSGKDPQIVLKKMNDSLRLASSFLKNTHTLLVTLGTSIVYTFLEKNKILANNHKLPAHTVSRRMLDVQETIDHTLVWVQSIISKRPDTNIIFTLSPVRYLKEGFTDNTRSKARLALAIESLCSTYSNVHYFPAYEMVLDDLRDYRFYKTDMIHPSDEAVDYIWTKFRETYFDQDTNNLLDRIHKLVQSKNHRPLHPDTMPHRQFLAKLEMDIVELKMEYPHLESML